MIHQHQHPTAEEAALEQAFRTGQSGFTGTFFQLLGKQLIDVNMMSAWRSRDWVVCLGSMRAGDGTQVPVRDVPIDNQVATFIETDPNIPPPPEQLAYDIDGIYLRVTFGTGNANDTAYVSYPFGGGSFQLHGGFVRVEMPSGFSPHVPNAHMFPPTLKGFIAPGNRSQSHLPPTLTVRAQVLGTATERSPTATFWAPPRAIGYRLYTLLDLDNQGAGNASAQIEAEQLRWLGSLPAARYSLDGTNVDLYRGNSNALDVAEDASLAFQRVTGIANDWRHLFPGAVGVRVTWLNPPAESFDMPVAVEWILDLG